VNQIVQFDYLLLILYFNQMGCSDTIRVDIKIYYDTQISVKYFCKMPTFIIKN